MMRLLLVSCLLAAGAGRASAQPDMFGPQRSSWGPRLDTIGASVATRALWRGRDLGPGAHLSANVGIHGRSVTESGRWHVSAHADGYGADARNAGGSRVDAALEVGRLLGESDAVATAWGGGYWLHDVPAGSRGAEVGIQLNGLEIPFVPEVRPTLHLSASRATGPLEGTFLGAAIRQVVGLQQYALRLEVGADIDDAARAGFTAPRWRAELGIAKGFGQWMARLEGGVVHHAGATPAWGGAGLSWRY